MLLQHLIVLAIIQGITEFIPISSSGHLVLIPHLLHWSDHGHNFEIAAHLGTLLALIVYFFRECIQLVCSSFQWLSGNRDNENKLPIFLMVATVPAMIVGFFIKMYGVDIFRKLPIIIVTTIGYGILMYICDKFPQQKIIKNIKMRHMIFVGFAQALALIPGTSRAGICITAMRFLKFNRSESAKFSFLLAIPVTFAAVFLGLLDSIADGSLGNFYQEFILLVSLSFFVGMIAIRFTLNWLGKRNLTIFAIYRIILGILLIFFL